VRSATLMWIFHYPSFRNNKLAGPWRQFVTIRAERSAWHGLYSPV
jgi:hypothetical protein